MHIACLGEFGIVHISYLGEFGTKWLHKCYAFCAFYYFYYYYCFSEDYRIRGVLFLNGYADGFIGGICCKKQNIETLDSC